MPEDLFHPVIQAVLAASQLKHEALQLKQRKDEADADRALREKQLNEQMKRDDATHKLNLDHLDLAKQTLANALEQHKLANRMQAYEAVNKGFVKPQDVPSTQGAGGVSGMPSFSLPSGQQSIPGFNELIQKGTIATPEDLAKQHLLNVGNEETARYNARIPFEQAKSEQDIQERKAQDSETFKRMLVQENMQTNRAKEIANINGGWREQLKVLDAQGRLEAARNKVATTEGQVGNLVNELTVTGTRKTSSLTKEEKAVYDRVKGDKITLGDNPKDVETLKTLPQLLDFVKKTKELATTDTGGASLVSNLPGIGYLSPKAGDIKRLSQEVEGQMGQVSRNYDAQRGVLTQQDIVRARELVSPGKTTPAEQNIKKAQDFANTALLRINSFLDRIPNKAQREAIMVNFGITPSDLESLSGTEIKEFNGVKYKVKKNASGGTDVIGKAE